MLVFDHSWLHGTIIEFQVDMVAYPTSWQGVPCVLQQYQHSTPTAESNVVAFCVQGGTLTALRTFGTDPLEGNQHLQHERLRMFLADCSPTDIFAEVAHGLLTSLANAIQIAMTLSVQLQTFTVNRNLKSNTLPLPNFVTSLYSAGIFLDTSQVAYQRL